MHGETVKFIYATVVLCYHGASVHLTDPVFGFEQRDGVRSFSLQQALGRDVRYSGCRTTHSEGARI